MSKQNTKILIDIFLSLESREDMQDFLDGILTPKEFQAIITRIKIIKMLKSKIPQQEIAKKLGVGIATVTRGSKEIQKGRFKGIIE